jgi:putative oxygen-independent coproporphyrinogen III oxidase
LNGRGSKAKVRSEALSFAFTTPLPLSLYVHIPWCVRKCPYCDFNSHEARAPIDERGYIDALLADLDQDLPLADGRALQSIFIGGGTPSLFSPESIDRLLSGVRARLAVVPDMEITLEANPGTVEQGRFAEFRNAGINRLSIGVQSFDDDLLERIGRIHGRREAIRAAESAHDAGLANFNLDLMYGLPKQTLNQALADLQTACDLEPAHLSHYQLTLEPNTWFHRYPPSLPDDEQIWGMQEACQRVLAEQGYTQYEVSAYSQQDGRQCRHNLNYWQFGDYLGIGAGAHAKLTDINSQQARRLWKHKQPKAYLQAMAEHSAHGGNAPLLPEDVSFEFMINALRLNAGFTESLYRERTGLALESIMVILQSGLEQNLLEQDGEIWRASTHGYRFLNDLLGLFAPESDHA